jgi:subtilisin family serine protease
MKYDISLHCTLFKIFFSCIIGTSLLSAQDIIDPTRIKNADSNKEWITYNGIWLFFTDKGPSQEMAFQKALSKPTSLLTARCIKRRQKVLPRNRLIDPADLPVCPEYIQEILRTGAKKRTVSRWFNGISVEATEDQIETISTFPFIREIRPVLTARRRKIQKEDSGFRERLLDPWLMQEKTPEHAIPKTTSVSGSSNSTHYQLNYGSSLDQVEQINVPILHDLGYDGSGVLIGMLDTGFRKSHEAFRYLNIVAEKDFVNGDGDVQRDMSDPEDYTDAHGTATWSTLAGFLEGELIGPAFGADFILAKTEHDYQEFQTEEDYWVAGVEWADSLGADIISSSLGYYDWYEFSDLDGNTAITTMAADRAAGFGILVVTAAGNERLSDWGHIIAPADADSVIAAGAVENDGILAIFSSPGPTYDGRIKPELCAMGINVICAGNMDDSTVMSSNGTSLSTPLIAGASALLLQIHPEWTAMDIRQALLSTASQHDTPDNDFGWGIVNALKASGLTVPYLTLSDHIIDDSNSNNNGQPEPGETLRLFVEILNRGTETAYEVAAALRTESSFVTLIDSTIELGTISPDSLVASGESFQIRIGAEVPEGTILHFILNLSDNEGRSWEHELDMTVFSSQWEVVWSQPELIYMPEPSHGFFPTICLDDSGFVHVLGLEGSSDTCRIQYIQQAATGWQPPVTLYAFPFEVPYLAELFLLPSFEKLYAIWSFFWWRFEIDVSAHMAVWDENAWSTPIPILEDSNWQLFFMYDCVVRNGQLHVAIDYMNPPTIYDCIYDGAVWTRNSIGSDGSSASMVFDRSGTLHMTFLGGGSSQNYDVLYTFSRDNGITWAAPVEVFSGPYDSQKPVIAVSPYNSIHIVWQDEPSLTTAGCKLLAHSRSQDGLFWSDPVYISNPDNQKILYKHALCCDRDGDLHLIWNEGIFSDWTEIYYAQYSREAWSQKICLTTDIDGTKKGPPSLQLDRTGSLHLMFGSLKNNITTKVYHMVSEPVCGPDTSTTEKPDTTTYIPDSFALYQNYPNPFNSETIINYDLPVDTEVELVIFNVLGQKVRTLMNEKEKAGENSIPWDGRDDRGLPLGSGTYLLRMKCDDFIEVKKMMLLR